ncbi:MAG TPA: tripartite tricarboxylate transporter substrate binding protein [Burkholderiales bacterium]|nr:tripartite tricarboxylate transporter substrate binding protein [Burkholderiales bacterium]
MGDGPATRSAAIPLALVVLAGGSAQAQTYPVKPVRIISPFVPGGPGDLLPRAIAAGLAPLLGQQVIVENRPGGSQIIGMQLAAKSPPDGYTLLFATVTGLATNVSAFRSLPYDPVRDFAPIALCFTTPLYLVVHPSLPVKSVRQLIALAKAQPAKLTFATGGHGTTNHLAAELFKLQAGVDMLHVPYKSAAPAMVDVMAGHVSLMFAAGGLAEARTGKVRALAVTTARRFPGAPELPTVQESGLPGFEVTLWFAMVAPAGTPASIVTRLSEDIGKVLRDPALRERFNTMEATPSSPDALAELVKREIPKWRKVFESAKIAPE